MKNNFEELMTLANTNATEAYGTIVLGTAGATLGAVSGGLMGAMGYNTKDVSVRALATLFGAAIGAVKGGRCACRRSRCWHWSKNWFKWCN